MKKTVKKTLKSEFLRLSKNDILKGILMSIITPVLVVIQQSVVSGVLTLDMNSIKLAAAAGGIGYLIKNFFTPGEK